MPAPHTEAMVTNTIVHAAGGIVLRRIGGGDAEVLLIFRARRGDWTFPKGKLEAGETHEECALREVAEETGLRCRLGRELAATYYRDRKDRLKVVRYWLMDPAGGVAEARNEVDAVRWTSVGGAARLLTHSRDRRLLAAFSTRVARLAFGTAIGMISSSTASRPKSPRSVLRNPK